MNKTIISLCIILSFFIQGRLFGQTDESKISQSDWTRIIDLLNNEKWSDAEKVSLEYLSRFNESDSDTTNPAIVRYMYLRCIAAKLGEKQYSPDEALEKTKSLIGKAILTPPKSFHADCLFNCFSLADNRKDLYSCSSNKDMTVIQIIEIYEMQDSSALNNSETLLEGKDLRVFAYIKEIENEGMMMPHFNIVFHKSYFFDENE